MLRPLGEIATVLGLVLIVPLTARLDAHVLETGFSERSATELLQQLFVMLGAVFYAVAAHRRPQWASLFILASGLCATMFVRELDMLLDGIRHGFWAVPAIAVAATAVVLAYRRRSTFARAWTEYSRTTSFTFALIGLLILLVFSRNFGSGSMWKPILGDSTGTTVKTIVQECLELLGYVLLARGAALAMRVSSSERESVSREPSLREHTLRAARRTPLPSAPLVRRTAWPVAPRPLRPRKLPPLNPARARADRRA